MPGGTGFDLLSRLDDLPQVIFTTAYDAHAVRAFEVDALDYLLKPIGDPKRLAEALSRARGAQAARTPQPGDVLEQIFVRDGTRCWFVPRCASTAAPVRKATTFACHGERKSPCSGAHWPHSRNVSIQIGSFVPIDPRSLTWTSSSVSNSA